MKLSDSELQRIATDHVAGKSAHSTAKALGRPTSTVTRALGRKDVQALVSKERARGRKAQENARGHIRRELRKQGVTEQEIKRAVPPGAPVPDRRERKLAGAPIGRGRRRGGADGRLPERMPSTARSNAGLDITRPVLSVSSKRSLAAISPFAAM